MNGAPEAFESAPHGPATLELRLVRSPSEFANIRSAWQTLEQQTPEPCFFQSYAWCGHVADVLMRASPAHYEPLVAVATIAGKVSAIWPLSRQKRSGVWELRPLDEPFGQFACILYNDKTAAAALVVATLASVRSGRLADIAIFDRVQASSPLHTALAAAGASPRNEVSAPVVDTKAWSSFADLKGSRNKKTMKNLRNATNRLTKAGTWQHRLSPMGPETTALISATLTQRTRWLGTKGLTAPQFRSSAHEEILKGGLSWGLDAARMGFELLCAGKPIARQWGFRHNNRYYAFMSSTDPEFVQLSPGRVHLAFVIEEAMGQGLDALELLTPASDYKLVWTDEVRKLHDLVLPLSAKGWLRDCVWDRALRPIMKAGFYTMPVALRRRARDAGH